ncbi:uncharacterized protein [Physcomitrium patens]|uniref:DUF4460 domain-containing protein n=1 Tax=Physcomitrium patens TaxID=3218 RepID=A9TB64_PHYPA|nr:uncharacterized protein LOC112293727 [Physcomitrium patens]XP_024399266.1 uncharacterized protein LOC112293727 [Physcomitrium patens]XP_024399267.1 uncharacterized protein LOC112293727 [Physcomitrium patens]PNR37935.1 hypothetical protein PHYPA_021045 [Physcomitrium patens]|eukprot:XP_024399265.1 uncharacterized protein LOC112293727 [Physcomitrella patens]
MWACGRELFSRRSSTLGQGAQHILQAIRWIHDDAQTFPKFKNELRRLYKLIHPDLLHNFPTEQATNLRSFQLLQEYLNAARGRNTSNRYSYHFEFFIKDSSDDETKHDNALQRVEVSLPPPQVKFHPQRGAEMLPGTKVAIGKLFAACGLSSQVGQGWAGDDRVSLSDFLQHASELQRKNAASVFNCEHQVIMVRNAMRMRTGVNVSFLPPLVDSSPESMEALEKLAQVLDRCIDIRLSGFTIKISDCYGVDALGNLWIDRNDGAESWIQFLRQVDLVDAADRKIVAKNWRTRESEVAKAMQVAVIFTHSTLAVTPAYSLFLSGMVEGTKIHGPIGAGKFKELPIRVAAATEVFDLQISSNHSSGCSVDKDTGAVVVPISANYLVVSRFISELGHEALFYKRKYEETKKKIEDLQVQARKRLKLRHLFFDPKLSIDQQESACARLLRSVPEFSRYTEGLSLMISDEYRLPVSGSNAPAYLKWDFSISDL